MPWTLAWRPYRLPFARPLVTATGRHALREGILLCLRDPEGLAGYGEVAPLPGHGGEPLEEARAALPWLGAALIDLLEGSGLPATAADWLRMARRLRAGAPALPAACAGLDLALADRCARRAGLPLARWIRPDARDSVPVNATLGAEDAAAAADQALAARAAGFTELKLKLGTGDAEDLARVAAVRAAVGPAVALRLDANGAWDPPRAIRMLAALAPCDIAFVEQPVSAAGEIGAALAALARVRAASPIPVAADELLLVPGAAERVLEAGAADLLVLKPALMGGPSAAWDLAARAASALPPVEVLVTSALDSAVGRLGALHLAAALPELRRACGLATGGLLAADVAPTPAVIQGRIALPDTPGLGTEPDGPFENLIPA